MNKKFVALLLLPAMLLVAPICLAQPDHDKEQVWLPPGWVFGSGYTPYDYPGSVWGWGYDPFSYYSYQGKTYKPYRYSYYYYPSSIWYPSYYQYNYDYYYYYPYTYRYYWYPYTYHSGYWWS
ncbi:MAG: hypothetical protein PHW87_11020 [Methanothrix sp.]|jgi:hypothetical protein|nr:hypothetical protein [Methanothrix sp.]